MRGSWFAVALVVVAAGRPARADEGDLARLQGCWTTAVGSARLNTVTLEIKGRSVSATVRTAQGVSVRADGELRLDEAVQPKALDWVGFTTSDGQEVPEVRGIYRLEGDRLFVRSGGFGEDRPTEFRAGDGIWARVLVFERPQARSGASSE